MIGGSLTIYVDRLCPFSNALRSDLKNAHVHPDIRVVDRDEDAAIEMYKLTQKNVTPVIHIKDEEHNVVLVGYTEENKQKMAKLLQVRL